ncbi:hypothetical protein I7I53_00630 [Histoplasma capsulatum var. duboisii H88]|uniref:Uncharacterized protein n=1 Tax=Ajellomyces capsulatus (strain H88) TaxID=544711 RepID=A0A8A1LLP6_AJEC8|nr:hypothetical protein I7I53_00630 [Histoplasma capsulatum var. duboisii H88]
MHIYKLFGLAIWSRYYLLCFASSTIFKSKEFNPFCPYVLSESLVITAEMRDFMACLLILLNLPISLQAAPYRIDHDVTTPGRVHFGRSHNLWLGTWSLESCGNLVFGRLGLGLGLIRAPPE